MTNADIIWQFGFLERIGLTKKNKEIILDELFQNQITDHINYFFNKYNDENILLFDLKYSNEFMERNIEFDFMPIAYLKIYFNENNQVIRSELLEGNRRINVREYKVNNHHQRWWLEWGL